MWYRYAVLNNPSFDLKSITQADMEYAEKMDPGGISAWNGSLSEFKSQGRKLLMWHGLQDSSLTSKNTARYFDHVASTLGNLSYPQMDEWYRHFRVPGMAHCKDGPGAAEIGQSTSSDEAKEAAKSNIDRNILLLLVRWVEEGQAPETLLGTHYKNNDASKGVDFYQRHCRYPYISTLVGKPEDWKKPESWACKLR
jgi:feruloyl esterase